MSDKKLISPLLDGFTLGNPMSNRSGVRCYPAIKENSDKKYIVKQISVPASQVQLDALLLTGAYKDPADAMDYFKAQADGIVEEAQWLQKLSRLEGFLPYEGWQVEPMADGKLGYRIFLVSSYKRTLEKYMRRSLMTHLQAINLGLDLCAAMAICRRAGFLYVDLKPANIFLSENREYRIGDLGFVKLDSLKFTSMPQKYVSPYSPPEVHDAINPLNETVDTYALGMVLYQIYNDGNLPFKDKAPAEELPSPCNADYEIAEIIMKAIAPKVEDRWADPLEMGKALAAYLQRNTVNNEPISTPAAIILDPEIEPVSEVRFASETETASPVGEPTAEEKPATAEEPSSREALVPEEASAPAETPVPEKAPAPLETPAPVEASALGKESAPVTEAEPEKVAVAVAAAVSQDLPTEADEEDEKLFDFDLEGLDLRDYDDIQAQEEEASTDESIDEPVSEKGKKKWLAPLVALLILAILFGGAFHYYQNFYLQTIDQMTVEGGVKTLTVILDTKVDNSLLSVSCTDTYGNTLNQPVENGKAVFTDLKAGTQYRLDVEIDGFHGLKGYTSQFFTTPTTTEVVSFTAVTGAEDGSVMLTFTIDGADTEEWVVTYGTEGEVYQVETFSGHSVTIRDLTVGKEYTFTLSSAQNLNLSGLTEVRFTASRLVVAENLRVVSYVDGDLKVQWTAPEDVDVPSWTVRCFSEAGEQQILSTDHTEILIPNIDTTKAYTVEVIAEGMTQAVRTNVSANPLTILDVVINDEDPQSLSVSWDFSGDAPEGGWLLLYSIDGSDYQNVVKCEGASGVISPRVHGASYELEIRSADGISIFENVVDYDSPNAEIFDEHYLPADQISANLLVTPDDANWSYKTVDSTDFTSSFALGSPISILLHAKKDFMVPYGEMNILYVLRDSNSHVVAELVGQETMDWRDMWVNTDYHYCELDLPKVPETPGNYTLALYFNGKAVMTIEFTVTE